MRGQFVDPMQVDIDAVLSSAVSVEKAFPSNTYIYFLIHNKEVVYVGQTKQLINRISFHNTCKTFDSFNYFRIDDEHANLAEAMMIVKFDPPLNNALPGQCLYVSYQQLKQMYGLSRKQVQALIGRDFISVGGKVYVEMNEEKYNALEGAPA